MTNGEHVQGCGCVVSAYFCQKENTGVSVYILPIAYRAVAARAACGSQDLPTDPFVIYRLARQYVTLSHSGSHAALSTQLYGMYGTD